MAASFSVRRMRRLRAVSCNTLAAGRNQYGDHEHRILAVLEQPDLSTQPRQQLPQAEGLGDVVVRTGVEPADHIGFLAGGGEHDDGCLHALFAEPQAHFPAVSVGQRNVEDDRVETGVLGGQHRLGLRDGCRLGGDEFPIEGDLVDQRFTQSLVVVNDKDRSCRWHYEPFLAAATRHTDACYTQSHLMKAVASRECR